MLGGFQELNLGWRGSSMVHVLLEGIPNGLVC